MEMPNSARKQMMEVQKAVRPEKQRSPSGHWHRAACKAESAAPRQQGVGSCSCVGPEHAAGGRGLSPGASLPPAPTQTLLWQSVTPLGTGGGEPGTPLSLRRKTARGRDLRASGPQGHMHRDAGRRVLRTGGWGPPPLHLPLPCRQRGVSAIPLTPALCLTGPCPTAAEGERSRERERARHKLGSDGGPWGPHREGAPVCTRAGCASALACARGLEHEIAT